MANGVADVCVCVLFYGADDKHYRLAERVLNKPLQALAERNVEFRFGCNAVGQKTLTLLQRQISSYFDAAVLFNSHSNILKYPMMREMFHAPPIRAPITMWFDHDSYIDPETDVDGWLSRITKQLSGCDMVGSVQISRLADEQRTWVEMQPWKTKDSNTQYVSHVIGSWWAINTRLLMTYNWPPVSLNQKGGEILLGELFRQQNLHLCHFREGVRINVNEAGVEAAQPRTMV